MIERVSGIATDEELHGPPECKSLASRQIDLIDTRTVEAVAPFRTERSDEWIRVRSRIKPLMDVGMAEVRVADAIGIQRSGSRIIVRIDEDGKGVASLLHDRSRGLPSPDHCVHDPIGVQKPSAQPDRQLVDRVSLEGISNVKVRIAIVGSRVIRILVSE